jgi:hypothetical protein
MSFSRTDLAAVLARFPGPVTLYPSRKKWLLVLAGGSVFAVGGALMIRDGDLRGWFVLIFFAAVALVAAAVLLPGAGALTLDRDGFEITNLFRHHRIRWQDASGFTAVRIPPARQLFVVFDQASASGRLVANVNVAIVGHSASLPDTYGQSAEKLAELMAAWRASALARE